MTYRIKDLLNHIPNMHHGMQFSPVKDDGDELTDAISSDVIVHDNQWQLDDAPDGDRLAQFWDEVAQEWGNEDSSDR